MKLLAIISIIAAISLAPTLALITFNQPVYAEKCTTFSDNFGNSRETCTTQGKDPSTTHTFCDSSSNCDSNSQPTNNRQSASIGVESQQYCKKELNGENCNTTNGK